MGHTACPARHTGLLSAWPRRLLMLRDFPDFADCVKGKLGRVTYSPTVGKNASDGNRRECFVDRAMWHESMLSFPFTAIRFALPVLRELGAIHESPQKHAHKDETTCR